MATFLVLALIPAAAQAAVVQGTLKETAIDYRNGDETTLYRVVSEGKPRQSNRSAK